MVVWIVVQSLLVDVELCLGRDEHLFRTESTILIHVSLAQHADDICVTIKLVLVTCRSNLVNCTTLASQATVLHSRSEYHGRVTLSRAFAVSSRSS